MFQRNGVGLDWSTLFSSEKDKEKLIKQIQSAQTEFYDWDKFDSLISVTEESRQDDLLKQAYKIVTLRFCIEDTSFARDLLSKEEFEKCYSCFSRKQYDSKLLKVLLGKFCYLLSHNTQPEDKTLNNLLKLDILRTVSDLREQQAEKTFMALKKQIEKIAAGVKGYCYLAAENPRDYDVHINFDSKIKTELNEYIKEKYSYDFNALNGNWNLGLLVLSGNHLDDINRIFQKALYNDDEFWEKHKKFSIVSFIEIVYAVNDSRHAEKILDFIFVEILKTQYGKEIINKSLPLVFLKREEFLFGLEERTFRFTFDRFKNSYNLHALRESNLCYPFSAVKSIEDKLHQGKQLVEDFLREIYPDEFEHVLKILVDETKTPSAAFLGRKQILRDIMVPDTVLGGNDPIILTVAANDEWTIRHIFDYPTFGYHDKIVDREAVTVYSPEYFSEENIWNRFYLKAFYMLELVKDKRTCFANMFEVYYDLFQFIEKKTGVKTSYQRNTEGRNEAYIQLKSILKQCGVNISDKYKSDYIISLLDRKVAIREESERFPVLEQLGDAVYGLALAEMLFYDPDIEHVGAVHNDFSRADIQIDIANKIGINKLYLSSYSLPRKYESDLLIDADRESYTYSQEREQFGNDQKYIADSLEMIIGTICRDCGYQTAIDFAKQVLRKTYPDKFPKELRWEDNQNSNIDRDYWTRILPAPYSRFEPPHHILWNAFDKFFKAYVLGTEDRETRQYITNSFGDNELYDDVHNVNFEVNKVFYEYLHKGLANAIDKFSNRVKEKYEELKK